MTVLESKDIFIAKSNCLRNYIYHVKWIPFQTIYVCCVMSNVSDTPMSHEILDKYVRPVGHARAIGLPVFYTTN